MKFKAQLFDENAMNRAIVRIAHEIVEKNETVDNLALIGIKTRGVPIAKRIAKTIEEFENKVLLTGILDITLYRDDLSYASGETPILNDTDISFDINGKNIVLVDDVIYTGRTVRAAMDALISLGRPSKIQLAELVDRGHREFPIRADYVGKNIPTSSNEIIHVGLKEIDGTDVIEIFSK